jgi:hypothetical protein
VIFNEVGVTVTCDEIAEFLWRVIKLFLASSLIEQNFISCLCQCFTVQCVLTFRHNGFKGNTHHHVLWAGQAGNFGWICGRKNTKLSSPERSDLLSSWFKGTFPWD